MIYSDRVACQSRPVRAVLPASPHPARKARSMLCHDPRISNIRWEFRETLNVALIAVYLSDDGQVLIDWDAVAAAADDVDWPRDIEGNRIEGSWRPCAISATTPNTRETINVCRQDTD